MNIKFIWNMVIKGIYRNKVIFIIQILCLTLGMIIPSFFLSQYNGALLDAKENDTFQMTDNLMMIRPDMYSDVKVLQRSDLELLKNNVNIKDVYFINRHMTNNIFANNELMVDYNVYIVNTEINDIWNEGWIAEGETWKDSRDCIIGYTVAQKSNLKIGNTIEIDGTAYVIKGISKIPKYKRSILLNQEAINNLVLWDVDVFIKVNHNLDDFEDELNKWLINNYGTYRIYLEQEINQQAYTKLSSGWTVSIILSFSSLIYSLVNVYNILFFYSEKTKKKTGVSLAIGANKRHIFIQKYLEIGINMFIASVLSYISLYFIQRTPIQHILPIRIGGYIFLIMVIFGQCSASIYTKLLLYKTLKNPISDILR